MKVGANGHIMLLALRQAPLQRLENVYVLILRQIPSHQLHMIHHHRSVFHRRQRDLHLTIEALVLHQAHKVIQLRLSENRPNAADLSLQNRSTVSQEKDEVHRPQCHCQRSRERQDQNGRIEKVLKIQNEFKIEYITKFEK